MNRARVVLPAAFAFVAGCTLFTDLSGYSLPQEAPMDGGRDVASSSSTSSSEVDANIPDVGADTSDVAVIDAGVTQVSCREPTRCGDREACCIVYGDHADFCVRNDADCVYPSSTLVVLRCDDETDCTALGMPGTVCCATLSSDGKIYTTIACVPAEQCSGGIQLCDQDLKKCPDGHTCQPGGHSSDTWECK